MNWFGWKINLAIIHKLQTKSTVKDWEAFIFNITHTESWTHRLINKMVMMHCSAHRPTRVRAAKCRYARERKITGEMHSKTSSSASLPITTRHSVLTQELNTGLSCIEGKMPQKSITDVISLSGQYTGICIHPSYHHTRPTQLRELFDQAFCLTHAVYRNDVWCEIIH